MTLRIHFTAQDLARTRIAKDPRPLMELGVAIRLLQERSHPARFGAWRRTALSRLSPNTRMLFPLIPSTGWSVDFLTPVDQGDPEVLLDKMRATPTWQIREELSLWAAHQKSVPAWTRHLESDEDLRRRVIDTVERAHREVIAPYWSEIVSLADADHALRVRHLAEGGMDQALAALNPRYIRWNAPTLELTMASCISGDLHLNGRGLLLIPTLFGSECPVIHDSAEPQPWLTYPIRIDDRQVLTPVTTASTLTTAPRSLSALLGKTRATVLCVITDRPGCTTTELAEYVGISPASASEHATVLRSANLISTARHRNTALHTPTPAGMTLLNSAHAGVK
ncbi:ArsR/SmtB family transcription factor [Streptomyces apocyni]|uniref:ArsR/SmtB family transcription factor n=1 Tax=Streptomyces apocyni TaxID=2654677 RepID=UPI0012EAC0BD|nr:winged helix-turn-helix domain-containing protein [Streptomyces apocyni]